MKKIFIFIICLILLIGVGFALSFSYPNNFKDKNAEEMIDKYISGEGYEGEEHDYQEVVLISIKELYEENQLIKQALCNLNQTQFCEATKEPVLYYCEDENSYRECPYGLGGTTRCYLNEEHTSWDYCSSGWILQ